MKVHELVTLLETISFRPDDEVLIKVGDKRLKVAGVNTGDTSKSARSESVFAVQINAYPNKKGH